MESAHDEEPLPGTDVAGDQGFASGEPRRRTIRGGKPPGRSPWVLVLAVALGGPAGCARRAPGDAAQVRERWDAAGQWETSTDGASTVRLAAAPGRFGTALALHYQLRADEQGWVQIQKPVSGPDTADRPFTFLVKAAGTGELEVKLIDRDGGTFLRRLPLAGRYRDWTRLVVYPGCLEYGWGGRNDTFDGASALALAVSGKGSGTVWFNDIGVASPGLASSFPSAGPQLDPDRDLPGIGFRQRRDPAMLPEDPGVLAWLEAVQDSSSPEQALLPSQEDNEAQTFNNALVAMAFIVKGERPRAERILDFYARATRRDNTDPTLQSFFYEGQARGFFQYVNLRADARGAAYHNPGPSDRWMGDMAWLLIACEYHGKVYQSPRYRPLAGLLTRLLLSWYVKAEDGPGGYVRSGWRAGDQRLHEGGGHPEGNIDAYAAFRLVGRKREADEIRVWLDRAIRDRGAPLDHYSWRVLAFGAEAAPLLDIPDADLRYRKTVTVHGREVQGFYHGADATTRNIWLDGTGHLACGFLAYGDRRRGFFFANQLDALLVDREVGGVRCRALPYTVNAEGGFDWVRQDRGFVSVAAWYLFAKNGLNPMRLERFPVRTP